MFAKCIFDVKSFYSFFNRPMVNFEIIRFLVRVPAYEEEVCETPTNRGAKLLRSTGKYLFSRITK